MCLEILPWVELGFFGDLTSLQLCSQIKWLALGLQSWIAHLKQACVLFCFALLHFVNIFHSKHNRDELDQILTKHCQTSSILRIEILLAQEWCHFDASFHYHPNYWTGQGWVKAIRPQASSQTFQAQPTRYYFPPQFKAASGTGLSSFEPWFKIGWNDPWASPIQIC